MAEREKDFLSKRFDQHSTWALCTDYYNLWWGAVWGLTGQHEVAEDLIMMANALRARGLKPLLVLEQGVPQSVSGLEPEELRIDA